MRRGKKEGEAKVKRSEEQGKKSGNNKFKKLGAGASKKSKGLMSKLKRDKDKGKDGEKKKKDKKKNGTDGDNDTPSSSSSFDARKSMRNLPTSGGLTGGLSTGNCVVLKGLTKGCTVQRTARQNYRLQSRYGETHSATRGWQGAQSQTGKPRSHR